MPHPSQSRSPRHSRLAFVLGGALTAILVVIVSTARFGSTPVVEASPESPPPTLAADPDGPRVPDIAIVDVAALDVALDIDDTLAGLVAVADQLSTRLRTNPDDHITATLLSSTLLAASRETGEAQLAVDAEVVADAALELAPNDPSSSVAKAQTLSARHDFRGALTIADRLLAEDPADVAALTVRADALLELGDVAEAESLYEAVAARERVATTVSRLSRAAFLAGEPQRAIDLSIEALELAADVPLRRHDAAFYWFQLASNLEKVGQIDGAGTALERAIQIEPTHGGALELLVRVREIQGRTDEAIEILVGLVDGGGPADLHGALSRLLADAGDDAGAAEQLAIALAAAETTIEDQPAERRHVAGFLLDHDPRTALLLARQDVDERQDAYAWDLLAQALLATGDAAAADDAIRTALASGLVDPVVYAHAADIAEALGDDERAERFRTAARSLHPQPT